MHLSFQDFSPLVGTSFTAQTLSGPLQLVLIEAVERPRRGLPPEFRTPLSLIFSGPDTPQLMQDSYQLDHPKLGSHLLMLVPIARHSVASASAHPTGPIYEAILS
ncbi:MAG: hypothetical protein KIS62_17745 [Ramlibacter sp.]|nr:hypothetical protein [Ramlibacter sp.]MBX3656904.1 hypothetical protein [Ramlibacter sp.]MCW5651593.1 hypothetical protein [Ramlibacter sp.]